jgi:hypothetical protein
VFVAGNVRVDDDDTDYDERQDEQINDYEGHADDIEVLSSDGGDSIFGTASTAETETFDDFELSDSDATATLSSDHSDYESDSDR